MKTKTTCRVTMCGASLAATLVANFAFAEVNFAAESVSVSEDAVTTYIGDVVVRATSDVHLEIDAKTKRQVGDAEVYEGDVRITLPDQLIKTEKAVVTKLATGDTLIKMDLAESAATQ